MKLFHFVTRFTWARKIASRSYSSQVDLSKIRNIGIIAHIDAGKTTTTERMLFYSGFSPSMGEVHDGDTITDYMPQERERGITITSATITFPWRGHKINLIDTPGHVDFTVEVERSLRVLDGAVTILDASAGVEAQTLTVWRQANRYRIPRIIYLNKMDKPRANFDYCLADIESKLDLKPLICQIPSINPKTKQFCGVFDVVNMTELIWDVNDSSKGSEYISVPVEKSIMKDIALERRAELIENLGALDDAFAEKFILSNTEPTKTDIKEAIRKVTSASTGIPLFCGSSYKNIGVQPLLDAIVDYIPDPSESIPEEVTKYFKENDTVALAFKILHTKLKGPLTFIRVYSGSLQPGKKIFIMNRDISEKCGELLEANADEYVPIKKAEAGCIVAVSGLKETFTGDTLVGSQSEASSANNKAEGDSALLFGIAQVEPVFQCSIEPPSTGQQKNLDHALACLQREDPSLVVTVQQDTGQTVISGMGSLHLEIIKDRIIREFKVEPYLGALQIAYREALQTDLDNKSLTVDKSLGGSKHHVEIDLSIRRTLDEGQKPIFVVEANEENELHRLRPFHRKALENGVKMALCHGPLLGFPIVGAQVRLTHFVTTYATSISMITAAISQCIHKALRQASFESAIDLLEPFMRLEISLPENFVGTVLSDLSRRRATIESIKQLGSSRVISAVCPLADLTHYSTEVRTITSGRASFTMEIDSYRVMSATDRAEALRKASGFQ
ncbi:ribosome-releasing factor 2, mitochondrial [Galendromus occidentalis]|uniref:Ribosome-releasing factor 2, mitochondrial n=1 Tax=Galendromus occidentalis TaxID=34638 RepID=A0AAJ6VVU0_9ACAR|nr:ribosome-releasing factor 2, mitochondrial [Galendromus occidentalis]